MLSLGIDFWPRRARAVIATVLTLVLAICLTYVAYAGPVADIPQGWIAFFAAINGLGATGQLVVTFGVFDQAVERTEARLKREYDRAEGLLKNILPDPIALRLKDGETVIADEHKEVSVVFADIVDFTSASARLSPRELVETLNTVFSEFDALALAHGAEKIKTIGDAYMVVIGVPQAHETHAEAAVALAVAMHRTATALDHRVHFPVRLRIGINSGPVVAGVIGTHKFAYDLWGDAVNVASRMESHGDANKVMVSDSTRALLGGHYALRDEGLRDLKGKGPTQFWSLKPQTADVKGATC
ncbi:adenylate/guanylate cyclase domain-containing protein [Sulfitobacter aestuariivivens]